MKLYPSLILISLLSIYFFSLVGCGQITNSVDSSSLVPQILTIHLTVTQINTEDNLFKFTWSNITSNVDSLSLEDVSAKYGKTPLSGWEINNTDVSYNLYIDVNTTYNIVLSKTYKKTEENSNVVTLFVPLSINYIQPVVLSYSTQTNTQNKIENTTFTWSKCEDVEKFDHYEIWDISSYRIGYYSKQRSAWSQALDQKIVSISDINQTMYILNYASNLRLYTKNNDVYFMMYVVSKEGKRTPSNKIELPLDWREPYE